MTTVRARKPVCVVVSGAGALGAKQAAALAVMQQALDVRAIGGSSAGAINAAGIALGVPDVGPTWVKLLTSGSLEDWHIPGPWPIRMAGLMTSGPRCGLMAGKRMHAALVNVFGDRRMGEAQIPLRICVGNLARRRLRVVDSQDVRDENLLVADVLRCTMAVPFLIDAWQLSPDSRVLYTDGGATANAPAGLFDDMADLPTVVVKFAPDESDRPIRGLVEFARAVMDLRSDASNGNLASAKPRDQVFRLDLVDKGDAFDFSQDKSAIDAMMRAGRIEAASWIARHGLLDDGGEND